MNLVFRGECVNVSHRTGVDIHCTSESQILAYVLDYMKSELSLYIVIWTSNKSAMFVLTNRGKKYITINRATNGD